MDLSFEIDISGALRRMDEIDDAVSRANTAAVIAAGAVAVNAVRANVNFGGHPAPIGKLGMRTGRLFSQVQAKLFRSRQTGLAGVAVKVIGDRRHIMGFHEFGTASHGGRRKKSINQSRWRKIKPGARADRGPLPARKVFATTYILNSAAILTAYNNAFDLAFNQTLPMSA